MLRLPSFTYLSPKTLTEATQLFAAHGAEAMFVAGGTDLYPNMKRRQFEPKALIGLRHLQELKQFSAEHGKGFSIGAGMTLTQVAHHPLVQKVHPALATAAGLALTQILPSGSDQLADVVPILVKSRSRPLCNSLRCSVNCRKSLPPPW